MLVALKSFVPSHQDRLTSHISSLMQIQLITTITTDSTGLSLFVADISTQHTGPDWKLLETSTIFYTYLMCDLRFAAAIEIKVPKDFCSPSLSLVKIKTIALLAIKIYYN